MTLSATAKAKNLPISAQKCRLVADVVRGLPVARALETLSFMPKKAALAVRKLLESVIANAEHNAGADIDELHVSHISVDEGMTLHRFRARAKGRGNRILKRRCHVNIAVSEKDK